MSDERQQDARTSFVNQANLIDRMRNLNCLQADQDHVLYVVSDGCAKQYKCANTLQTYMYLADRYQICINVMIMAPYHGKSLVDALAGLDKTVLKRMLINGFDSAIIDDENKQISQAEVCHGVLANSNRKNGDVNDTKHKRRNDESRVDERHYRISNYDSQCPIPLKDCTFKTSAKQWGNGNKNKQKEMYEYCFSPDLPLNTCAVCRLPCFCKGPGGCNEQKLRPWDFSKTAQDQERFQRPVNCKLFPMMKDMNDWIFIKTELVQTNNDVAISQCNKVLNESINLRVLEIKAAIKPLHFAAISCNDKRESFWLVQWRGEPFQLTQEEIVEGGTVLMHANRNMGL